jgi:magnesium transporter
MPSVRSEEHLQRAIGDVTRLLEKHRVLTVLAHRQEGPRRDLVESLQHRQNLVELHKRLRLMHSGDVAFVLEALPHDERRTVWEQLAPEHAGQVLVEVADAIRQSLVVITPREDLIRLLLTLDPEDLAFVADSLALEVRDAVFRGLESRDRLAFDQASQYEDASVGRYMTREWVALPETHTIQRALTDLRRLGELPPQTDRIFVVDARNVLRGTLPLPTLVLTDPSTLVAAAMTAETMTFGPHDHVGDAAKAFERYDLVSAPVVDDRGKLVGRLTVDAVMDFVRDESNLRALKRAGLSGDEDLFAGPWQSARNRWPWLAINLVTAFIASRVIGQFEGEIQSLASLAALMPIVASIGGNTGNQTMALVIRGLALDRIQPGGARRMFRKELGISLLNGLVWGLVVGFFAVALYANLALGLVMTSAVVLNLVVAALAGVGVPLGLHATGRDPAHGSSVLLTFITDAMGFFLFLGLASVFLLQSV